MRKVFLFALAAAMTLSLAACGTANSSETAAATEAVTTAVPEAAGDGTETEMEAPASITIQSFDGAKEVIELEVPYNPERLAVMDLAVLDILDNLGVGDRVVGVSKGSSIDYLQDYVSDDSIVNLGTIKEADLEAVMESEPDVIFIGGRLSSMYDALSEIAPVVYLPTADDGVVATVQSNGTAVASLFGMEAEVTELMSEFDARIRTLADFAAGKTAIIGMVNNGGFGVLGNDGRCSIIGVEIGFDNLSASEATSTHGNESSFELLVAVDPDYIFAIDRDAAIGTEGARLAAEVLDNELVRMTSAYADGNIVVLEHSNVWYTAEGGITALDIMLADLESAILD